MLIKPAETSVEPVDVRRGYLPPRGRPVLTERRQSHAKRPPFSALPSVSPTFILAPSNPWLTGKRVEEPSNQTERSVISITSMRPGLGADTLGLRSVLCRQGSYEPVSQGFGGRSFTANYDAAAFFILWRFTCTGVLAVGLLPLESAAFREHLSSIL